MERGDEEGGGRRRWDEGGGRDSKRDKVVGGHMDKKVDRRLQRN